MQSLIAQAVEQLRLGHVVAFPTETVYGLGADALNCSAVETIYRLKNRPSQRPLIVHVASYNTALTLVRSFSPQAQKLAHTFWPGPLALIAQKANHVPDCVTGGQSTVAVRVPAHPLALQLLETFQGGIAAPSANLFGHISPTHAHHVQQAFPSVLTLDGGPCSIGIESTIVDVSSPNIRILRPGFITQEAIEACLQCSVPIVAQSNSVRTSGQDLSHYAPQHMRVMLVANEQEQHAQALHYQQQGLRVALWPTQEPIQQLAQSLYHRLREQDMNYDIALIAEPPSTGLGAAILDRLRRAAHPK